MRALQMGRDGPNSTVGATLQTYVSHSALNGAAEVRDSPVSQMHVDRGGRE